MSREGGSYLIDKNGKRTLVERTLPAGSTPPEPTAAAVATEKAKEVSSNENEK